MDECFRSCAVACLGAPPVTLSGVAPKTWAVSYRVFYNGFAREMERTGLARRQARGLG